MTSTHVAPALADDDATLARAAAAGNQKAFAAIYDRYADRLHDFCVGMLRDRHAAADCVQDVFVTAASRLAQLREPERLRSWLYAIARNEALAVIRARRRELPSEELPEITNRQPDLATLAARSELADLISDACGGLAERDQVVLELSYRKGLAGPELAEALGVTPRNANVLVERLRDTIARSLGALLVCRQVRANPAKCPELAALIEHWDGQFTVLMRKRAARHIDGCPRCEQQRASMVTPAALLGAAPVIVPAPAWLREHTLSQGMKALPSGPSASTGGGASSNESWWPANDLDTTDLPDGPLDAAKPPSEAASASGGTTKFLKRHVWAAVGVAGVVVAGGVALVEVPQIYSVHPAVSTDHPTTAPSPSASATATVPRPSGNVAKTGSPDSPTTLPPTPASTVTPGGSRVPVQTPEPSEALPTPTPGRGRQSEPPPSTPTKPSAPQGNSGGPTKPPAGSGGSGQPPGGSGGSGSGGSTGGSGSGGSSSGSSGGSSGGSGGGPTAPTSQAGKTAAPGHLPSGETGIGGGPNNCVPPTCIPTNGPAR
ncbi:sigma-70 family RNA polymerase sigma factor [Mycobacterium sp. OAE908]|uniref:RNA polymerase sigma factor n=1 Tax=Mycobacterium sp. OAE908 TaxID=2817899 RepID=UPI001AE80080